MAQYRVQEHVPEPEENHDSSCPQMYLIWWSATGLTAAVLLIELDRFIAIRFPLDVFSTTKTQIEINQIIASKLINYLNRYLLVFMGTQFICAKPKKIHQLDILLKRLSM